MTGSASAIRLMLVDDHTLVRSGLRTTLESVPQVEVVGEAGDGREAVQRAEQLQPDLMLMDIAMPNLNGIEATRRIASGEASEVGSRPRVLALSMHGGRGYIQQMLRAGASGYLLKTCGVDELVTAIHSIDSGHIYLMPEVAHIVVSDYLGGESGDGQGVALSQREREVLQLVAEGLASRDIARRLKVTIKTVESHRQRVMNKLKLHNAAGLTRYALREGITTLDL